MKKQKTGIVIILLAIIFITQFYFLYNKTVANTILDYKKSSFNNDLNYKLLENLTTILLENIDDKEEKAITLIFNNETAPYEEFGIGYLYIRHLVFPMKMYTSYEYYTTINNKKYLEEQIQNEDLDYILLLGKDTQLFNQKSTKDYTLYKVIDKKQNQIQEIESIDFNLYSIYQIGNKEEFYKLVGENEKMIKENWSFPSISLMYNLAIDFYENDEYDMAIKYSNYYLNTIDYINDVLNMNLGHIYTKLGNIDKAIEHYYICQRNQACDKKEAQAKIDALYKQKEKESE